MIKRTQHSLGFLTSKKRQLLDNLFSEYQSVVNCFIQIYWSEDKLKAKPTAEQWRKVDTWLMGKAVKCAYRQAIQIVRSAQDKNKKKIYKAYKRAFIKAKNRNRNWDITNQKWSVYSKSRTFRQRVKTPEFNGNSIDLNSDLVTVYLEPKKLKHFDLVVRLGSIFGNRFSLVMPTKKHKLFNRHIQNNFHLRSSVQLRRINGKYYVNLFLEKETPTPKTKGKTIGVDVGIKKLMVTTEKQFIGTELESKIQKLKRRKRNSVNYKQTLSEIKDYIGQQVNQLDLDGVSTVVVEDLKVQGMSRKGRSKKEHRRTLGNWNSKLLFERLINRCEENRVLVMSVNPCFTSQKCSNCGETHEESRKGEVYKCLACGFREDADYNASINIRSRFLDRECTVPCEQEQVSFYNFT